MKTKYYRYNASVEAQEFIDSKFGSNDINAEVNGTVIELVALEGIIKIEYKIIDTPLVFEGHQFEELRDFRVEFSIEDKFFTTKSLTHRLSLPQIVEKAVTAWVTCQTKVFKDPVTNVQKAKLEEEQKLLKALKAQKTHKAPEIQVKAKKRG